MGCQFASRHPDRVANGMLTLLATLWAYWGVGEMYYEGWWGYGRLLSIPSFNYWNSDTPVALDKPYPSKIPMKEGP
jgi:hypothetical protein